MDESLAFDYEKIFEGIIQKIQSTNNEIRQFIELGEHINNDYFDDEDKQMILSKIDHAQARVARLREELSNKKNLYANEICKIERCLVGRKESLEQFDERTSVFEKYPDLLRYFAKKHITIYNSLKEVRENLIK